MKRIVLGMGVVWGLLGAPWALQGQGYVGPKDVPFGAVRALKTDGGPAAGGGEGAAGVCWGC